MELPNFLDCLEEGSLVITPVDRSDIIQGLGIGSRIFKHLVTIARASGITQFEADVLPWNEGMLRLFTRSGHPIISTRSMDSVHITIDWNPEEKRV